MSDEDLKEIDQEIEMLKLQKERLLREEIKKLVNEARLSGEDWMLTIAEAMAHDKLKMKPLTPKLPYVLAKVYHQLHEEFGFPYSSKGKIPLHTWNLLRKIQEKFDMAEYVFQHTHFDSCDNGFFFRRS